MCHSSPDLTLLDLKTQITKTPSWKSVGRNVALQICLFLLHPYALLVYIVLSFSSIPLLARDRPQLWRGLFSATLALLLFIGWSAYNSMLAASGKGISLSGLNLQWWPLERNLSFLVMIFTGMRFTRDPNWLMAALWATLLLFVLLEYWWHRSKYRFNFWFPVLFCMAVGGYFVLPFSIHTDGRYTFFNLRMAPISFFLLVPIVAALPVGRFAGRVVIVLCLTLTCHSAYLHDRISGEIEGFVPIFDKMEKNASVLTLFLDSRSEYLDPYFYVNFHSCFPFYYHILKGGGVNPDMFHRRLMPVGYREGRRSVRPSRHQLQKWVMYRAAYDYVLVLKVPRFIHGQLENLGDLVDTTGPWSLYKLRALPMQVTIEEAIEHFHRALRIKPDDAEAHYHLGIALHMQGKTVEAIESYHRALRIKPDLAKAHDNLGVALQRQGKTEEAIKQFHHALQIKPDLPDAHYNLGFLFQDQGDISAAVRQYKRVLDLNPDFHNALNNLAWIRATHPDAVFRDGAKAVELAERSCELTNHQGASELDTLAAAYAEAGRFGEAIKTASKVIDMATAAGDKKLAREVGGRVELYLRGVPYRERKE